MCWFIRAPSQTPLAPPPRFPPPQANEQCGQPWLLSGNYCRATCGRCTLGGGALAASPASEGSAATSRTGCSDVLPPGVATTCSEIKVLGMCSDSNLMAGGFCAATCARCHLALPHQAGVMQGEMPTAGAPAPVAEAGAAAAAAASDCTDEPPPGEAPCPEQKAWGKCESEWMVAANYCAATCGRCSPAVAASSATPAAVPAADGPAAPPAAPAPACADVPPPETDMSCAEQKVCGGGGQA